MRVAADVCLPDVIAKDDKNIGLRSRAKTSHREEKEEEETTEKMRDTQKAAPLQVTGQTAFPNHRYRPF
jgi:hypothetical protein